MDQRFANNRHGILQDEVIRLLHTPRPRCKGFFADLPPEERYKYVIPPPPGEDERDEEDGARGGVAPERPAAALGGQRNQAARPPESGDNRQMPGRRHAVGRPLLGAIGDTRPRRPPQTDQEAREDPNRPPGPADAARGEHGSRPRRRQHKTAADALARRSRLTLNN
ncbi:hypothetical protein HPB50_005400 [Hyalomma asiaticum]|uniref:Uncharacterized protein n=1 Tax=Hyalomma asiaticum TaxID=266040 RepID=A0ACB7RLU0_HYAAI|nr:hypothetical protein HPB50_005400 [Hyalomma asiaticum]